MYFYWKKNFNLQTWYLECLFIYLGYDIDIVGQKKSISGGDSKANFFCKINFIFLQFKVNNLTSVVKFIINNKFIVDLIQKLAYT